MPVGEDMKDDATRVLDLPRQDGFHILLPSAPLDRFDSPTAMSKFPFRQSPIGKDQKLMKTPMKAALVAVVVPAMALALLSAPSAARRPAIAAEAMAADDAKTWKTLLNDKDFEGILNAQVEEIKKGTRSSGTFMRGFRKLELTGRLVAMLGNIGTLRFEGEDAKKAAALREAGLAFADAAKKKSFADAQAAYANIEAYPQHIKPASEAKPTKWADVIAIEVLMKGVSAIDTATGGAIRKGGATFTQESKEMAAQSKLLACLAVISREYNDAADWKGFCDAMREGSMGMAEQFAKKNEANAKDARTALQKSCTDCHDVYRAEE